MYSYWEGDHHVCFVFRKICLQNEVDELVELVHLECVERAR